MQTIFVELGERRYPIYIGLNLFDQLAELIGELAGKQIAVITNPTVAGLYGELVSRSLNAYDVDCFEMPDGEAYKNLDTYGALMDFLMSRRHNRSTCLVALGGGVVGDLTGFAAATFQRGVDFVQIPTTLLAQVDSSVGGKTAVNHAAGKNMIGAFYQPKSVIVSTDVLATLPARQYAAGLAEVVKYGIIDDPSLFEYMVENVDAINRRDNGVLSKLIARSCEIKAKVVAADERETGLRAMLNFGHTFGHAIEKISGYGKLLHGEAVAIGMLMATRLSEHQFNLSADLYARIETLLNKLNLPTMLPEPCDSKDMLLAMGMDKKAVDGQIRFVLARAMGDVVVMSDFSERALMATLEEFCKP